MIVVCLTMGFYGEEQGCVLFFLFWACPGDYEPQTIMLRKLEYYGVF